jgi:cell division protein FtsI (penicillin-binding protein 3)
VVSLALEKGLARPTSIIATAPGRITIGGSTITDSHAHGDMTVTEVIQKSSNVGTVRLAMQLQPREMWELYTQLGLGQRPQLPFPGVVSGKLRGYKTWRPIEQATMSYGYGLSTSLFQLARAYTVFARDGELVAATMLKTDVPAAGVRVLQPATALAMRQMLHLVTLNGGTAPKAQTMGYSVGGKTGTAHKQEGRGYAERKYRGVFVGLAPIDKPRIVVAVMIDEPSAGRYFGGDVAAPVFSATVQQSLRMLGVQPDMNVKPQIVVQAVEESF